MGLGLGLLKGMLLHRFSCVWLFATSWVIALPGSFVHGILQAKNTGVGCHFLLQRIFLTQDLLKI